MAVGEMRVIGGMGDRKLDSSNDIVVLIAIFVVRAIREREWRTIRRKAHPIPPQSQPALTTRYQPQPELPPLQALESTSGRPCKRAQRVALAESEEHRQPQVTA